MSDPAQDALQAVLPLTGKAYIDGEWIDLPGAERLPVINPASAGPRTVATGIMLLRSACRSSTTCEARPFALAVRM